MNLEAEWFHSDGEIRFEKFAVSFQIDSVSVPLKMEENVRVMRRRNGFQLLNDSFFFQNLLPQTFAFIDFGKIQ